MSKKFETIITVLSIVALCLSLVAIVQVNVGANKSAEGEIEVVQDVEEVEEVKNEQGAPDVQYVLYLGTNDKDTNKPVFTPDEAKKEAEKILLKHFGGYTIQQADGGWVDGDTVYTENTLVIYLSDTDLESIHAAADEMIKTFHQSSVLIQENQTTTEFYAGE